MAPLRSLGNIKSVFDDFYARTGNTVKPPNPALQATGGNTTFVSNGFKYHVFTTNGNFVTTSAGEVDLILIAGGGGGGSEQGGGGGAGALHFKRSILVTAQSYPVVIGDGGAGGAGVSNQTNPGAQGNPSTAFGITAAAGGSGNSRSNSGNGGGSGGGSGGSASGTGSFPGGVDIESPPAGWGNPAGSGTMSGGGGAASSGGPASGSGSQGGVGGLGARFSFIPPSYGTSGPSPGRYFAGGGSGGYYNSPSPSPAPAGGGGGAGATGGNGEAGGDATPFTGAGGGGGGSNYGAGGDGSSGIAFIRYPF